MTDIQKIHALCEQIASVCAGDKNSLIIAGTLILIKAGVDAQDCSDIALKHRQLAGGSNE